MNTASEPDTELDLFLTGSLFFDIIFTGLPTAPQPGTEVWAEGMGSVPGGIANLAVAAARLGLATGLSAGFGDDAYGAWSWSLLAEQEGIDLSRSRIFEGWHSALTVSLARGGDRSMITHGHPMPISAAELIGTPPTSKAMIAELAMPGHGEPWWIPTHPRQGKVFAAVGWDPTEKWDTAMLNDLELCHGFLPNHVEAMAYSRTDSPDAALKALSSRAPLVVITRGMDGAIAIDSSTGEQASVPSLSVAAIDPTGAGDVFSAGIVLGTLAGWPLERRLLFSTLCSALAVKHFGGSLASPGWGDIADWWESTKLRARENAECAEVAKRYGFLDEVLPQHKPNAVRRAEATFGLLTEAEAHYRPHGHGPLPPSR
ncbi:carbohydrate kinase family protein [Arthrobacter sp. AQ5-05]|uniref:PfkB family carbohydrate kinase n=1 Tax=Arthrobacter sp. AQ5-05 TaxID=2184581 RepID=UPI000DCE0E1C|nr:PfkB family carbohydrate kinase [Arthrobacter sp. AQ5-05]RAX50176.1 carbohydrate kinase family protein [Arthrobacter sp. AQ5-05]